VLLRIYYYGDQITKNEIGGACSMYGGDEKHVQGLGGKNLQERNHLENLDVNRRIILKWILRKLFGALLNVAQDRDRWRAFVSAVMNLRFPQNAGNFLTS
jgi:hypothetical protein